MAPDPATLTDLIADLTAHDPDADAVFRLGGQDIQAGYHVTELKLAQIDSVDCAGRHSRWTEAQVQILDGYGGRWMPAGKLAAILRKSADALPGLADVPASVEFAPGNTHLARHQLGAPEVSTPTRITIPLLPAKAACKPATRYTAPAHPRRAAEARPGQPRAFLDFLISISHLVRLRWSI